MTPKFNWTVTQGKITRGQGTSEVSVEAEGDNSITATVEVIGYPGDCQNKASNTTIVERIRSRKPGAPRGGKRAKKYLVEERGLQESQIEVISGGHRETRSVELFITPFGALPPTATPTRSPG